MADTENQLEIDEKVVENDPVVEKKADEPVEKAEREVVEPEEGINDLKARLENERKALENERRARIEAENRAREAVAKQYQAQNEVEDSNLQLVKTAIETVKGTSSQLKAEYRDALAVGDHERAAEIQEAMTFNAARLMELERGRHALENRPKQRPPEPEAPSDPIEALASQLSPRSADWVRAHPQCVTDPRMYQKMVAAHNMALADGIQPDTDDYFAYVEDTLKIRKPEPQRRRVEAEDDEDAMSAAAAPVQRRAPPAAPVSRSASPGQPRTNQVRLTAEQREAAEISGLSEQEYYAQVVRARKEGQIN